MLGFTKAEKIWSILNLKNFLAGIIFSINSTLLSTVTSQAAEKLQLSVLWENIVQANLSPPSPAILSQLRGVLTPAINFVNPAEHILWQTINPKQVKWETQPGYLQSSKMLQARYGHEQRQWPAQHSPTAYNTLPLGTWGWSQRHFQEGCVLQILKVQKTACHKHKWASLKVRESQKGNQEAYLSLSVGQISWDNVILDKCVSNIMHRALIH